MKAVGISTTHPARQLKGAAFVRRDFRGIAPRALEALAGGAA
jgi:hypothetical protein